ncbi:hypothetical protein VTO42DRAFT_5143 [Malbranchea cinnamomea]
MRDSAFRPSDDSPFVNEIFNPKQVDKFYYRPEDQRLQSLSIHRSTNYSVVRLELIERIYEHIPRKRLRLVLGPSEASSATPGKEYDFEQVLEIDALLVAIGYVRKAHEEMMKPIEHLKCQASKGGWTVQRNYKIVLDPTKVSSRAGIWLQGCNEVTHGLSDTLLSILAVKLMESTFTEEGECQP